MAGGSRVHCSGRTFSRPKVGTPSWVGTCLRGRLESGFVSVCQELGVAWLLSKFGPLKGKKRKEKEKNRKKPVYVL